MMREKRIADLEAENARLREQIEALVVQVAALQARLAKDKPRSD